MINEMGNSSVSKVPVSDGLTKECYEMLWNELKELSISSLN